jgi:hypothetical protein
MKLFVFAHRGEALAFIQKFHFKPVDFVFNGLLSNEKDMLLICGEGPQSASEKTTSTLAVYHQQIETIINIGIAGSLVPKLSVGDHAWIRSSYAQNGEKCEFKSFTSKMHTNVDCITSYSRVTTIDQKKELSPFADIVDRELWSVASAAHLFKKELLALKLISDEISGADACQLIKEDAPNFSQRLLDIYSEKCSHFPTNKFESVEDQKLFKDERFYFTTTQARRLTQLLHGLKVKGLLSDENELKVISQEIVESFPDKSPKDLSRILLSELDLKLNPLKRQIKSQIENALLPLTEAGIVANYDGELESSTITISHNIRSAKDQKRLVLALEHFNYQKIKDIFDGKLS